MKVEWQVGAELIQGDLNQEEGCVFFPPTNYFPSRWLNGLLVILHSFCPPTLLWVVPPFIRPPLISSLLSSEQDEANNTAFHARLHSAFRTLVLVHSPEGSSFSAVNPTSVRLLLSVSLFYIYEEWLTSPQRCAAWSSDGVLPWAQIDQSTQGENSIILSSVL